MNDEEIYELKLTWRELVVLSTLTEHALKLKRTEEDRETGTAILARINRMIWDADDPPAGRRRDKAR